MLFTGAYSKFRTKILDSTLFSTKEDNLMISFFEKQFGIKAKLFFRYEGSNWDNLIYLFDKNEFDNVVKLFKHNESSLSGRIEDQIVSENVSDNYLKGLRKTNGGKEITKEKLLSENGSVSKEVVLEYINVYQVKTAKDVFDIHYLYYDNVYFRIVLENALKSVREKYRIENGYMVHLLDGPTAYMVTLNNEKLSSSSTEIGFVDKLTDDIFSIVTGFDHQRLIKRSDFTIEIVSGNEKIPSGRIDVRDLYYKDD